MLKRGIKREGRLLWLVLLGIFIQIIILQVNALNSPTIQLAFGIMIYQKDGHSVYQVLESFIRLWESLHTPERHLYVIHLDIKSDPAIHNEINKICGQSRNCIKIYSRNVAWGSLSTAEMMLALMQEAYESEFSWQYFILLGHESIPIVNLQRIEDVLRAYPSGTNFINCWNVEGYNFFGQYERNHNRLIEVVIDNFSGSLLSAEQIKRTPPTDIVFYKSLQQMILSSEFVHFAVYGPLTKRIMMYLANVKTSDEMLIPTILQASERFAKTAKCDTTLQYSHWIRPGGSWHPEYLTLEHLPLLVNPSSPNLIARKVDTRSSASLLLALHRIRIDSFEHLSVHEMSSNESTIPSISAIEPSFDKESWYDWLYPMTVHYYDTLFKDFFSGLDIPSGIPVPTLSETGKSLVYRLTCCNWDTEEILNRTRTTCRNCNHDDHNAWRIIHDDSLLSFLTSLSSWEELCVGLVCGKISPLYITAANHLLNWRELKPSVFNLLTSLNELRE